MNARLSAFWLRNGQTIGGAVLFCTLFTLMTIDSGSNRKLFKDLFKWKTLLTVAVPNCEHLLNASNILTVKGKITYGDILEDVYKPMGYRLSTDPTKCNAAATLEKFLPLEYKCQPTCAQIFAEWLAVEEDWKRTKTNQAPDTMPDSMKEGYTMKGNIAIAGYYLNELNQKIQNPSWSVQAIEDSKRKIIAKQFNDPFSHTTYAATVVNALAYFKPENQRGLVLSSPHTSSAWVEAACLLHGASQVDVVTKAPSTVDHPQLKFIHPFELAKTSSTFRTLFDFAVSFSALEHVGLGRFGDPLDPIGDLREMDKVNCLLKEGGLFFVAVPSGPDLVAFNAHRIYGDIRWPLMAAGWRVLGAFHGQNDTLEPTVSYFPRKSLQAMDYEVTLYVLQKDSPNKSYSPSCD